MGMVTSRATDMSHSLLHVHLWPAPKTHFMLERDISQDTQIYRYTIYKVEISEVLLESGHPRPHPAKASATTFTPHSHYHAKNPVRCFSTDLYWQQLTKIARYAILGAENSGSSLNEGEFPLASQYFQKPDRHIP